jgi:hypothetical protein
MSRINPMSLLKQSEEQAAHPVQEAELPTADSVYLVVGASSETVQTALPWTHVRDGLPECDGETVFIGVNTAGFAACFNAMTPDGVCLMGGPESCTAQMSCLLHWRVLDRPDLSIPESGAQE